MTSLNVPGPPADPEIKKNFPQIALLPVWQRHGFESTRITISISLFLPIHPLTKDGLFSWTRVSGCLPFLAPLAGMLFREALYYQNIIALEEGGELIAKSYQSLHHEHTNHPHQFAGSWVVLGAGSQTQFRWFTRCWWYWFTNTLADAATWLSFVKLHFLATCVLLSLKFAQLFL